MIRGAVPKNAEKAYIDSHLAISALYELTHGKNLISEAAVAKTPDEAIEYLRAIRGALDTAIYTIEGFKAQVEAAS